MKIANIFKLYLWICYIYLKQETFVCIEMYVRRRIYI